MLIETAKRLTGIKNDLVVVGSTALSLRGLSDRPPKDLDLIVGSLNGLDNYEITTYETRSVFSGSGRRAFVSLEQTGFIFDIFVESEIPDFDIINGVRVVSVESALRYYRAILPAVDAYHKPAILKYIKIYSNE